MVAPPPVQAAPEIVPVEIDKEAKWWYRPGNKRYDRDHGRKYPDRYYSSYRFKGPSWSIACARKYRSFDPWSGTFLGRDGERHRCRLSPASLRAGATIRACPAGLAGGEGAEGRLRVSALPAQRFPARPDGR
jgi:hypothetical protein